MAEICRLQAKLCRKISVAIARNLKREMKTLTDSSLRFVVIGKERVKESVKEINRVIVFFLLNDWNFQEKVLDRDLRMTPIQRSRHEGL